MSRKMKVKSEHLGERIKIYRSTYDYEFTVSEDADFEYLNSIGLGYLFEEVAPKKPKDDAVSKD